VTPTVVTHGRPISGKQRDQAGASAGKREYVQKLWNRGTAALGEGGEEGNVSGPGGGHLQVVAGNEGEEQKGIKHHYLRTKAGLRTGGWLQEEGAQQQPGGGHWQDQMPQPDRGQHQGDDHPG
jgi:hypothetical protein